VYFMQRGWAPDADRGAAAAAPLMVELPVIGSWQRQANNLADQTKK
jgi:Flp pilus assembly secretin CpaC